MAFRNTNTRLLSTSFLTLVLVSISLSGCKKDQDFAQNHNDPGTVSGTVTPTMGVVSVSLHSPLTGELKHSTSPSDIGAFTFSWVAPGQYTLRVTTTALYNPTNEVNVSVASNHTTLVPAIDLVFDGSAQNGTIDFTLDGTPHTIGSEGLSLNYYSSDFTLGGGTEHNPDSYFLGITISDVVTGPGTYSTSDSPVTIAVAQYSSQDILLGDWSTNNGGTGTVTITTLDPTGRTISGTFTATLAPQQGGTSGPKQLSGSFKDVMY